MKKSHIKNAVMLGVLCFIGLQVLEANMKIGAEIARLQPVIIEMSNFANTPSEENLNIIRKSADWSGVAYMLSIYNDKASPKERTRGLLRGTQQLNDRELYTGLEGLRIYFDDEYYEKTLAEKTESKHRDTLISRHQSLLTLEEKSALKNCFEQLDEKYSSMKTLKQIMEIQYGENYSCRNQA